MMSSFNDKFKSEKSIIKFLTKNKAPVLIFGAGEIGKLIYFCLKSIDIPILCFCDNDSHKWGTSLFEFNVISPEDLKKISKETPIIIAASAIGDIICQITEYRFYNWVAASLFLRNISLNPEKIQMDSDRVNYFITSCLFSHDSYYSPEKLLFKSVDLIITERCSLKCRDCSNLMQYYKKPKDVDLDLLMITIDKFLSFIDHVYEFRVIGGEPFLYKNLSLILEKLSNSEKIDKIIIYTNGTIIPSGVKLECLKNSKIYVITTDYGEISKNLHSLKEVLKTEGIKFYINHLTGWTDCAKIYQHNRSIFELECLFSKCCVKDLFTLSNGELHRCPFSAHIKRLQAAPHFPDDYVNLLESNLSKEEMKNVIRGFMEKKFIQGCDYCDGRVFGAPLIKPAIQIKKPVEYKKYEFEI